MQSEKDLRLVPEGGESEEPSASALPAKAEERDAIEDLILGFAEPDDEWRVSVNRIPTHV